MIDGLRRAFAGSVVASVVGHPATEHDAEREEDCGDDERAQEQHRRASLVAPELFKRRMVLRRRLAFVGRRRSVPIR